MANSLFILAKNSKLSATAPVFIPRQSSNIPSLKADANNFVPECLQNNNDTVNFSQREKLVCDINSGQLECVVCLDKIQPFDAVWSCRTCFHIIHLSCIIKWAESSKSAGGWRCCACQNISKFVPREYFCFCGKTKKPQYNQYNKYKTAHSCGEVCGRRLNGGNNRNNCPHQCQQPCHPGPCPSCQMLRLCDCGKTTKMLPCYAKKEDLLCDLRCYKMLNCRVHACEKSCHSGFCGFCPEIAVKTCYCEKAKRLDFCTIDASIKHSCGKICDKQLKCGNHKCTTKCHAGACVECEQFPGDGKTCPCGKLQIDQRTSCTDPLPLCTATCGKRSICGHICASKCHLGPCPCTKQAATKCTWSTIDCLEMNGRQHYHVEKCMGGYSHWRSNSTANLNVEYLHPSRNSPNYLYFLESLK